MIPPVVASERGAAQTTPVAMLSWGCRTTERQEEGEDDQLESWAVAGDSPLSEAVGSRVES